MQTKLMIIKDTVLITKKIIAGCIIFLIPLGIIGALLWLIQFWFLK